MRLHLTGSDEPSEDTQLVRLVPDKIAPDLALRGQGRRAAWLAGSRSRTTAAPSPTRCSATRPSGCRTCRPTTASCSPALARYELGWDDDPEDVRALGIDRYGLVLRVRDCGVSVDLRIAFDRTVTCGCDVREAFGALLSRAIPGAGPIC